MDSNAKNISLPQRVRDFCTTENIFADSSRPVAVALSGGADSVALLLLLIEMGINPTALHCNFHLRGEESDRDCRFCSDLCARLGVRLETKHFDVAARMKETGESVEMACRELRYAWWHSLDSLVAVAHHADDNVETLLLNLLRGSGVRGLKGMPTRRDNIVRPLLCTTRAELISYLDSKGQDYVTDSTNLQSDYRRNYLRNEVLPVIEKGFPGASASIAHSIECLRGDMEMLEWQTDELENRFTDEQTGAIDVAGILSASPVPAQALYAVLNRRGFSMPRTREVMEATLRQSVGASWTVSGGISYQLARGGILQRLDSANGIEPHATDLSEPPFARRQVSREEFAALVAERNPRRIFLDGDAIGPTAEFVLRGWQTGDRLKPFGMKGSRLVSDIYSDAGIGAAIRNNFPILTLGTDIIWVVGLRASRLYAVGPETVNIISIEYNP